MNARHKPIEFDQAILGYDGGHRLLSASRTLTSRSKHAVLQLSDRSADASAIPDDGYLTGYPLPDDGYYVFSRTWTAPEMPRPGCVWTHCLLISFTDLAEVEDLRQLLALFRRPRAQHPLLAYDGRILFEPVRSLLDNAIDVQLARRLAGRLYTEPDSNILLSVDDHAMAEATLLALWSQQWPRLRRSFSFCSLTAKDRSTSERKFDVQFLSTPLTRRADSDPSNLVLAHSWLDVCVNDLISPDKVFRAFLRRAGGDISGGRLRFAELCDLYSEREKSDQIAAIEKTLDYVSHRLSASEGRLLRKTAIGEAIRIAPSLNAQALMAILPHLDDEVAALDGPHCQALARRYWDIDPDIVVGPSSPSCLQSRAGAIIADLSNEDALMAMRDSENVARAIYEHRPDVLSSPQIWRADISPAPEVYLERIKVASLKKSILAAIASAQRTDLVDAVCNAFDPATVLRALLPASAELADVSMKFIAEALRRHPKQEEFIGMQLSNSSTPLHKQLIHQFTKIVPPSFPAADSSSGEDAWAAAWSRSLGRLDQKKTDSVHIFFVLRALSTKTAGAARLLSVAFDPLYERLISGAIGYEKRSRLSQFLVSSDWWDWSFEGRLLRTIANVAVERNFSAEDFLALTGDRYRRQQLIRVISGSWNGRAYMKHLDGS
ncbi:hypothetical protein [Hyphococcus sp.]|uniref:GAP1-N1 domain-containing protein n=1 Tax=Hyphococcus sp. TaxID=2038636 RepID=UPI003D0A9FFD